MRISTNSRKVRVCFICSEACAKNFKRCRGIAGVAEFVDDAENTDIFVVTSSKVAHDLAEAGFPVASRKNYSIQEGLMANFSTGEELVGILTCLRSAISHAESHFVPESV